MSTGKVEMGGAVEGYTLNSGNSAPVGGRRRHMKKVSAKTIKRTLKRLGLKPKGRVVIKGGEIQEGKEGEGQMGLGGRRRRHHTKKTHRRSRHLFGMRGLKY
jgi:hypothetical protein